jgi:hypothetical protein
MPASGDCETIGTAGEISGVDLFASEIFDAAESEVRKIASERCGIEEQLKGFTGAGHSLDERVERPLLRGAEKRSFDGVVKCEAAARSHAGNKLDGRVEGGSRKIGRDAEPGEERTSRSEETRLLQPDTEKLRLKVKGSESHLRWDLDASLPESCAFPCLGGGMIHFKDMQSGRSQRITVSERVESRAQHDILANSPLNGCGELILGVAAAGGDECSEGARKGRLGLSDGVRAGDRNRQRIVEDRWFILDLMRRAP